MNQVAGNDEMREHLIRTLKRVLIVFACISTLVLLVSGRHTIIEWIDHPVSRVTLSGDFKHLNEQAVQEHLEPYIGVGFLNTDLRELKGHIEKLAWVHSATVKRVWPGEFYVQIEEQVPVSYWNENGLLNAQGELFTPQYMDKTWPLPVLRSKANKDQQERQEILNLLAYIQNELAVFKLQIVSLEQGLRGDWVLQLDNGIKVILGKVDLLSNELRSLDNKLERVGKLLMNEAVVKIETIQSLDTRYPNGIAVEWKDTGKKMK